MKATQNWEEARDEMSKYHKLVEKYSEEINKIKAQAEKVDRLRKEAEAIDPWEGPGATHTEAGWEPDLDLVERQAQAWSAHDAESQYLDVLLRKLAQDIEHEYWNVPFTKSRQAGIAGFWRESGLEGLR
jgi:hypothetical protein